MTEKNYYAALLNKRVLLQTLTEASDGAGGFTSSWATTATLWAAIDSISTSSAAMGGGEHRQAMQLVGSQFVRITIRYRAAVTTAMRVVLGSRVFNIRRVNNKDEQNRVLELIAEEGVAV